ncbi:MAG: ABC transporter substrate-binding protein [Alphaproteobacteria bacterium]|nr:ABC transporter substrate-binding protein [Alphaproteobacteria bacterium]
MPDRRSVLIAGSAALLLGMGLPATRLRAQDRAEALIRELGQELLEMLRLSERSEREKRFRGLLLKGVDVETLGGFVLGPHRRSMSPAQRGEYLKLFEDFLVQTYVSRLGLFSGQSFSIRGTQKLGEAEYLVQTHVEKPESRPIRLDWRVRDRSGAYRIIDVMVEGISMAVTQREEFASVIRNGGGRVEALLDQLRLRIAAS